MERISSFACCLLMILLQGSLFAQVPQIQRVEPITTYPGNRIVISGTGFSNTPSQLQVWFDDVKGTIASSSDYAIEVDVPPQARLSNVEVINLTSKLSGKSGLKFAPAFYGEPFDPAKFTAPLSFTAVNELWDLASCDLNNDGKPELISTKFSSPATDLMILQNQSTPGNLSFTKLDKTNLPVLDLTFPSDNVVYDDLQGDGKPDLIITRSGSPRNSVIILANTSAASISFAAPLTLSLDVGHLATRSFVKDVSGDGKPDIVVSNTFNNVLYIFQNTSTAGTLSFNPTPVKITVTGASNTYSVDVQDFDGDGMPDILVNQFQTNDIFLLKNSSAGAINFPTVQKISVVGTLNRLVSVDLNNDQLLDLVITNTVGNQIIVMINQSTQAGFSFPSSMTLSTSNGPWGVDVADIDGDRDLDLVVANRNATTLDIFLHDGNFPVVSFTKKNITTVKPSRNIVCGDLDGDAKPDIAFTSFNSSTNSFSLDILRNKNCHQPVILNKQPLVVCSGQTIRLKEVPAFNVTFSWKDGATPLAGSNSYLDITTPGNYTVTATGEGGACALTSSTLVVSSDPAAPPSDPVITAPNAICSGTNLQLSTAVVASATYLWNGPNNFTSSLQNPTIVSATGSQTGVYTLQVTVGACKSNVVSARVDVADFAELIISTTVPSNTICQGSTLKLSIASDPSFTYQWIKDGSTIGGQTANSLTVSQSGDYQVAVDNTNFVGCIKTTAKVSVVVLTPPVSAYNVKLTGCAGETISFTNQSVTDPLATPAFSWDFGDSNFDNTTSPTHAFAASGNYTTSLNVQYAGVTGCSSGVSKGIVISNPSPPTIVADPPSICPSEVSALSITGSYTSVVWSDSNTGLSTSVNTAGDYSLTAVDVNGCPVTAGITVLANQVPDVVVSADVIKVATGGKAQLQATGADSYTWSPPETLSDATIANPIASPVTTTMYTVVGALTGGCSGTNQILITVEGSLINIKVPPAFSPNGDQSNDFLEVDGILNYPKCTLTIYDGRGRKVFQALGDGEKWDGNYQGKPVPEGTYYFVFACPEGRPVTGNVLVFR